MYVGVVLGLPATGEGEEAMSGGLFEGLLAASIKSRACADADRLLCGWNAGAFGSRTTGELINVAAYGDATPVGIIEGEA